MNKELEIWQFAAERLERDEPVMLLTVAESSGSSPGRQGFKMIVAGDGLTGSIGGGVMEVNLTELAKESLAAKDSIAPIKKRTKFFIKQQIHQKSSPNSSGMICSGRQTVIFLKLTGRHLKTVRKIILALERFEPKTLKISDTKFEIAGNSPDEFDFSFEKSAENEFFYQEKLGFKNRLFIIGGGHCALALSELAAKMDFYISLFDDRADLNTLAKNKFVHAKNIIESYENIGGFIPSGVNVYVVVMTLGYKFDEIVISQLIHKDFKYFGVLGSRAKMKVLLKALEKEGFSKEKLSQIHTPIGLPINSRTPEEIAISIAAEIIAVKNRRLNNL